MKNENAQIAEPQEVKEVLGDFDPRVVQERDSLTGRIKRVNAHTLRCVKGVRYYEWPKGSQNLWWENRKAAGRIDANGEIIIGAEHIAWDAPRDRADDLKQELDVKDFQNKQLMKELDSIKKEIAANKFAADQKRQSTGEKMIKKDGAKKN